MVGQTIIVPFDVLSQHLMMMGTPPSKEYKVRIMFDVTLLHILAKCTAISYLLCMF